MSNSTSPDHPILDEWIKKWQAEIVIWKNMLASRVEENVSLKNKLTNILKYNYNQDCLEEIEQFQTKSIREDEITRVLKKEIDELDKLLENKDLQDDDFFSSTEETMKNLRKDIAYTEHSFGVLISTFQDFQQKVCREEKD